MVKGFTYGPVLGLLRDNPGMTSREVAELALTRGLAHSDAKDPVTSLATSLAKEVREGRQTEIRAERVNGTLRYYPQSGRKPKDEVPSPPPLTELRVYLPPETIEIVDLLAESRRMGRSDVVAWLIDQGITGGEGMDKVAAGAREISQIKRGLGIR